MKNKLKLVAVFLIILMSLQLVSCVSPAGTTDGQQDVKKDEIILNETGYPIVNQKITLKGFAKRAAQHGDWNEILLWKKIEEITNIHIEWETPGDDNIRERMNLLLASGDLPDFILKAGLTDDDITKYGPTGTFIALERLIEKYATNIQNVFKIFPEVLSGIKSADEHIYSLPEVNTCEAGLMSRYPLMNMKWLENLKLKVPATSDELIEVLTAFRDNDANNNGDPTDEIPYSAHTFDFAIRGIEGMFGLDRQMAYTINIEDGKVNLWVTGDKYKAALQYFKSLFEEKLVDQEIFTSTSTLYFGKLADGKVGYTPLYQPRNAGQYASDYDAIEPIEGPEGDRLWAFKNSVLRGRHTFAITSANKYPEATIRMIDYFYSDEGATLVQLGVEGITYEKKADGTLKYLDSVLDSEKGFEAEMGQYTIFMGGQTPGYYTDKHLLPTMEGTPMPFYIEKVRPYLPETVYVMPLIDKSKYEQLSILRSDIDTYVNEMRAQFIMGETSFDEWDNYVETLKKMGIDEMEQIYQEAFDKSYK